MKGSVADFTEKMTHNQKIIKLIIIIEIYVKIKNKSNYINYCYAKYSVILSKFMDIKLLYGISRIFLNIPDRFEHVIIIPKFVNSVQNPLLEVKNAISKSINNSFNEIKNDVKKVAIAINDQTRPVPNDYLLTPLLEELKNKGIFKECITFIIATGTHRKLMPNELRLILPEIILKSYRVICHDCDKNSELTYLGKTKLGTPVLINSVFFKSDIKIVVGNIEPHHFMGFSGGAKSAAIGLAGRKTIDVNHKLLMEPNSSIGIYNGNPIRQDVEEIGDLIGINYALNSVLNYQKEIINVYFGSPRAVMKEGILKSREICHLRIPNKFDIVIASAGGYPKDINLYQSQKAITNASLITKENGVIILVAACSDGIGSAEFEKFIHGKSSFSEVIEKFQKEPFRVGAHKAFLLAVQGIRNRIFLVSNMEEDKVSRLLLSPFPRVKDALDEAIKLFTSKPRIAIMPYAINTIPLVSSSKPIED